MWVAIEEVAKIWSLPIGILIQSIYGTKSFEDVPNGD